MPWCEQCDTDLETEDLTRTATARRAAPSRTPSQAAVWFKFLAVATVIYLGYRAFQGVTWVIHHV